MDKIANIKQCIDDAEVVSFDIFDTLIVRLYEKPTDVFLQLQDSYRESGFYSARIEGERIAREIANKSNVHEVTLEQIYLQMNRNYRYLMEKEMDLEKACCVANEEMRAVYDYAKVKNKIIYISSDMYLPQAVIEHILHKNGYMGYKKLFLSAVTMRPKATGEMYDDILAQSGVNCKKIVHIGDNDVADFQKAIEKGFNALLYKKSCTEEWLNLKKFFGDNFQYSAISSLYLGNAAYLDTMNQVDFWYDFGNKYFGLLLFAYCKWLHSEKLRLNISKFYFMLRDGYIVKKVYDLLYPDDNHNVYIYGSRRLFLFAGMQEYNDIKMHVSGLHTFGLTYEQVYQRLGINDTYLEKEYCKVFDKKEVVKTERDLDRIDDFFRTHVAILNSISEKERKRIVEYLKSIDFFEGNIGIVDLGWKGSMLKSISKICKMEDLPVSMSGFYLATHECTCDGLHMNSFLMHDGKYKTEYPFAVLVKSGYIVALLELVFSASFPSVINLKRTKDTIQPIYAELFKGEDSRIEIYKRIETGILDFIKKVIDIENASTLRIQSSEAMLPLVHIDYNLSEREKEYIAEVDIFPGVGNDSTHYSIDTAVHADFFGKNQEIINIKKDMMDIPIRKFCKAIFYYMSIHFLQKVCIYPRLRKKYDIHLKMCREKYNDFLSTF